MTLRVLEINELTLRQLAVPDHLLGRAHASTAFLAQIAGPLGALTGRFLASIIGTRFTLLIAVLGSQALALWTRFSPLCKLQTYVQLASDDVDSSTTGATLSHS